MVFEALGLRRLNESLRVKDIITESEDAPVGVPSFDNDAVALPDSVASFRSDKLFATLALADTVGVAITLLV